jgi:hypothetical protein
MGVLGIVTLGMVVLSVVCKQFFHRHFYSKLTENILPDPVGQIGLRINPIFLSLQTAVREKKRFEKCNLEFVNLVHGSKVFKQSFENELESETPGPIMNTDGHYMSFYSVYFY